MGLWFLGMVFGLLSSLGGSELDFVCVLWLGSGFVFGCWVWDEVSEDVMFKGVASRHVGVVGCVVGWVEELPVGGKGSVLGFELNRH